MSIDRPTTSTSVCIFAVHLLFRNKFIYKFMSSTFNRSFYLNINNIRVLYFNNNKNTNYIKILNMTNVQMLGKNL